MSKKFHSRGDPDDPQDKTNSLASIEKIFTPLKPESEARAFKLIDERDWNIIHNEPSSESTFFCDGHSGMSIISVIGSKGCGKSTLLNKIANRDVFKTYKDGTMNNRKFNVKHITKGVDIYSTYHRILLDCQPLLAPSVLEEFLLGASNSQFPNNTLISDPLTSSHMISLQLATFLIATCDYVIIKCNWLADVHILKLIASAIMMIGDTNLRAKFILYTNSEHINNNKVSNIIRATIGLDKIDKVISDETELIERISPYLHEKCELYSKDPSTFTAKNWLSSCQRLWNNNIRNSSMFLDYAVHVNQHSS